MPRIARSLHPLLWMPVAALLTAWVGADWLSRFPYGWLDDDAYFYLQIAYNLATRHLSSFDGIHVTDGYHLLWTGILALVSSAASLFTHSKSVHHLLFLATSIGLLCYLAWRFGRTPAERSALFGLGFIGKLAMETVLLGVLLLALIDGLRPGRPRSLSASVRLCLLGALVPLTRIDASPLVLILALPTLRRPGRWRLGPVLGGLAGGIALQLLLNRSIAGSWWSVSALLKAAASAGVSLRVALVNLTGSGLGFTGRLALLVGLAGICGYLLLRARPRPDARWLAAWAAACAFSFGHLVLQVVRTWYYVPGHLILAYTIFELCRDGGRRRRHARAAALGLIGVIVFGIVAVRSYRAWEHRLHARDVAGFVASIARFVPPEEAIFQVDASGITGFWSHRSIVNGDGLVNTHDYARRLLQRDLEGYLEEEGLCYLVANRAADGDTVLDYQGLIVRRSDVEELLRVESDAGSHGTSRFVLYRRTGADCEAGSPATGSPAP